MIPFGAGFSASYRSSCADCYEDFDSPSFAHSDIESEHPGSATRPDSADPVAKRTDPWRIQPPVIPGACSGAPSRSHAASWEFMPHGNLRRQIRTTARAVSASRTTINVCRPKHKRAFAHAPSPHLNPIAVRGMELRISTQVPSERSPGLQIPVRIQGGTSMIVMPKRKRTRRKTNPAYGSCLRIPPGQPC